MRILLLELPQMLRDLLEDAIGVRHDCELWDKTTRTFQVPPEPGVPPDVVILGLAASDDAKLVPALFARWPRAQVMTVMPAGEGTEVYELRPRRRTLDPMSPAEIVETLREAVHRRRELPLD